MHITELTGRRVAVWGFGHEGQAAISAIRAVLPQLPLTLYCNETEAVVARAGDPSLIVLPHEPDAEALSTYHVVVKSPGISSYHRAVVAAQARGTVVTSGTALWFAQHRHARIVAITGTKGKSTTAALVAHLARALGLRTALAGNIGLPLLALQEQQAELWVLELSSFQTGEAGALELGVVTSLYEEHLDWHGSRERYVVDKLRLAEVSHTLLVNGLQPHLLAHTSGHLRRVLFGTPENWHVKDGAIYRRQRRLCELDALPLTGMHNALNASAALMVLETLGLDAVRALPDLIRFRPLPHRLQVLGHCDGIDWINDSISTTLQATMAALDSLVGREITVIVGGHDRGLDVWPFVKAVKDCLRLHVVTQGASGVRIARALLEAKAITPLTEVADLGDAVATARLVTPRGGVVLFSPGAPSFDQFDNYIQRGCRFATLAGLADQMTSTMEGLGIA